MDYEKLLEKYEGYSEELKKYNSDQEKISSGRKRLSEIDELIQSINKIPPYSAEYSSRKTKLARLEMEKSSIERELDKLSINWQKNRILDIDGEIYLQIHGPHAADYDKIDELTKEKSSIQDNLNYYERVQKVMSFIDRIADICEEEIEKLDKEKNEYQSEHNRQMSYNSDNESQIEEIDKEYAVIDSRLIQLEIYEEEGLLTGKLLRERDDLLKQQKSNREKRAELLHRIGKTPATKKLEDVNNKIDQYMSLLKKIRSSLSSTLNVKLDDEDKLNFIDSNSDVKGGAFSLTEGLQFEGKPVQLSDDSYDFDKEIGHLFTKKGDDATISSKKNDEKYQQFLNASLDEVESMIPVVSDDVIENYVKNNAGASFDDMFYFVYPKNARNQSYIVAVPSMYKNFSEEDLIIDVMSGDIPCYGFSNKVFGFIELEDKLSQIIRKVDNIQSTDDVVVNPIKNDIVGSIDDSLDIGNSVDFSKTIFEPDTLNDDLDAFGLNSNDSKASVNDVDIDVSLHDDSQIDCSSMTKQEIIDLIKQNVSRVVEEEYKKYNTDNVGQGMFQARDGFVHFLTDKKDVKSLDDLLSGKARYFTVSGVLSEIDEFKEKFLSKMSFDIKGKYKRPVAKDKKVKGQKNGLLFLKELMDKKKDKSDASDKKFCPDCGRLVDGSYCPYCTYEFDSKTEGKSK